MNVDDDAVAAGAAALGASFAIWLKLHFLPPALQWVLFGLTLLVGAYALRTRGPA